VGLALPSTESRLQILVSSPLSKVVLSPVGVFKLSSMNSEDLFNDTDILVKAR
jgi:hypothetical protein